MVEVTPPKAPDTDGLEQARRDKLRRWREEFGIEPYGGRVDDLVSLAEARSRFDRSAHDRYTEGQNEDPRPRARVAGRCVQHRAMGKLVFVVLRDESGDLQVSISKAEVPSEAFAIARKLDYGDIVAPPCSN